MDRLGLGYATLSQINPKLIYCSISGYGATGPMAKAAGHDINYMATAGVLGLTGKANAEPQVLGFQAADATGALNAALGILAAVIGREVSQKGQFIDISLAESAMVLGIPALSHSLQGVGSPPGKGILDGGIPNYNVYTCSDGKRISLGALESHFWAKFCNQINRKDLLSVNTQYAEVQELFGTRTSVQWMELCREMDVCIEVVITPEEIASHPQHISRNVLLDNSHYYSNEGNDRLTNHGQLVIGPRLSDHPAVVLPPASDVGEHTRDILTEIGLSESEINSLEVDGVISCN